MANQLNSRDIICNIKVTVSFKYAYLSMHVGRRYNYDDMNRFRPFKVIIIQKSCYKV